MKKDRFVNLWPLVIILLVLVIIAGGVLIFIDSRNSPGIEISVTPAKQIEGKIYISGEISNPGLYPVFSGDTLEDIIRAAGGV